MDKTPIKILICSSHSLYRECLGQAIFWYSPKCEIVSCVGTYQQAKEILAQKKIDFLLIRLEDSILNPFKLIQGIKIKHPDLEVVILTFWDHEFFNKKLIESGAKFCYLIDTRLDKLMVVLGVESK